MLDPIIEGVTIFVFLIKLLVQEWLSRANVVAQRNAIVLPILSITLYNVTF